MIDPTGYIIFWIIGFGPVFGLGLYLGGKIALWANPRCPHRTCEVCNSIYHQSWHDDQHPMLCGHCQGAT